MNSIKFIVREFETKKGVPFTKADVKGKFLPLAVAEDEVYYTVRFVGKSVEMPTKAGVYEVAFEDGGMWIDSRAEYADKHILRIKAVKCVFTKHLPKLDKDVRVK